jgi:hypothetical protein
MTARGRSGDEVHDYEYNFTNARRRSNSSNHGLADFKTKFETIEAEPVFEEEPNSPTEKIPDAPDTISKAGGENGEIRGV